MSSRSLIYDFHSAIGQYIDYRGILKDENIDQELYLALPEIIYEEMKTKPFYAKRLLENNIREIVNLNVPYLTSFHLEKLPESEKNFREVKRYSYFYNFPKTNYY